MLTPEEFAFAAAERFGQLIIARCAAELDASGVSNSLREQLKLTLAQCMQQSYLGHSYTEINNNDCLAAMALIKDCQVVVSNKNHACRLTLQAISHRPVVLWGNRLYLARYWSAEARLASAISQWLGSTTQVEPNNVRELINHYLPLDENSFNASQREAILHAMLHQFTVIAGGPGTGKTTAVKALLTVYFGLWELRTKTKPLVALVAPTGKAAMRLSQALQDQTLIEHRVSIQVSTIHALIGKRIDGSVRFNALNLLSLDLLIVDEASMLDVVLADQVLAALKSSCKVVLLGDANQLTAVETGAFFHDLCALSVSGANTWLCRLRHTFRFNANSVIAKASSALESSNAEQFVNLIDPQPLGAAGEAVRKLASPYSDYISAVKRCYNSEATGEQTPIEQTSILFTALNRYRVLVAINEGASGQRYLGSAIDNFIRRELNQLAQKAKDPDNNYNTYNIYDIDPNNLLGDQGWYQGQAILFLKNDSALGVSNGDAAIIWRNPKASLDADSEADWVARLADGRQFNASLIQHYTTAWVTTVHKAQGSEFEHIALVLPPRAVDKSLLYTALTRSTSYFSAFGRTEDFQKSVLTSGARHTSIIERLSMES